MDCRQPNSTAFTSKYCQYQYSFRIMYGEFATLLKQLFELKTIADSSFEQNSMSEATYQQELVKISQ